MHRQIIAATGLLAVLLVVGLVSCNVSEPERIIRAPVIKSFSPQAGTLHALSGIDTLVFSVSALDPDEHALEYYFTLGDSVVSTGSTWMYVVRDTGEVEVKGNVTNGQLESYVAWRITRIQPENRPPIITDFQPPDLRPSVIVGNPIEFFISASDPEHMALSYVFTVDDSLATPSNRFRYVPTRTGPTTVRAIVTDGETFSSHDWLLAVLAEPDSIAPGMVTLLSVDTGEDAGELVVEWSAVGGDGMDGLPSHYVVKTSSVEIDDEHSWDTASERTGAPIPVDPGETMRMTVRELKPANLVFIAVRASDAFGNLSPLGNTLGANTKGMEVSGTVRDPLTGDPIPNVSVWLLSRQDTTEADGTYALTEMPEATTQFRLWDEDVPGVYGDYSDLVSGSYTVRHRDVVDFWMMPDVALQTTSYPNMLAFLKSMATTPGPTHNFLNTWDLPIQIYVPPLVARDVDYEQVVRDMAAEWEAVVGFALFEFVDDVPEVGVFVTYHSGITSEFYDLVEYDERNLPIVGRIWLKPVYKVTTLPHLRKVVAHELGHVLGMSHSRDQGHLMVGGRVPVPSLPTQDEIWLVRAMYRMPRGANLDDFLFD